MSDPKDSEQGRVSGDAAREAETPDDSQKLIEEHSTDENGEPVDNPSGG